MRIFLTAPRRLARILLKSREAWKNKTKKAKYNVKKLTMRVSYLKKANQALHAQLRQAHEKLEQLGRARAGSKKDRVPAKRQKLFF